MPTEPYDLPDHPSDVSEIAYSLSMNQAIKDAFDPDQATDLSLLSDHQAMAISGIVDYMTRVSSIPCKLADVMDTLADSIRHDGMHGHEQQCMLLLAVRAVEAYGRSLQKL